MTISRDRFEVLRVIATGEAASVQNESTNAPLPWIEPGPSSQFIKKPPQPWSYILPEYIIMQTGTPPPAAPATVVQQTFPDLLFSDRFLIPFNTFLEYAGAALGIIGWLGVRQIGNPAAQQLGFVLWVIGGATLVAWGYYTKSRGIMMINMVNTAMAASALAGSL